jgi:hypothetical protein
MVIRLVIDFGKLVKGGTKRGEQEKGMETDGFCRPCVCLGVFLS